jgi:cysteine desulfurase/selenocysteine lyase
VRDDIGVRAFDVFCPASFATTLPWIASLELLLDTGIDTVAAWDQRLVDRLLAGVDPERYRLISPAAGPARSTLVVLDPAGGTGSDSAEQHRRLTEAGIDTAHREGNLRLSVHLFNGPAEIDRALAVLHAPRRVR